MQLCVCKCGVLHMHTFYYYIVPVSSCACVRYYSPQSPQLYCRACSILTAHRYVAYFIVTMSVSLRKWESTIHHPQLMVNCSQILLSIYYRLIAHAHHSDAWCSQNRGSIILSYPSTNDPLRSCKCVHTWNTAASTLPHACSWHTQQLIRLIKST